MQKGSVETMKADSGMNADIVKFAKKHKCEINKEFLNIVLKLGRCPCRIDYVKCPCKAAAVSIEKTGQCHCGLFRRIKD